MRHNDMILGRVERAVIATLVRRAPPWVTPDRCTAVAVAGAALAAVSFAASTWHPAFLPFAMAGLTAHWLGDSMDGSLARHRHSERPRYGFYVDHVADTVCQILILAGLGASPYVTMWVALLCLAAYQGITILTHIRVTVFGEFRIAFARLGPTEGKALLVALTAGFLVIGPTGGVTVLGRHLTAYDLVLLAGALLIGTIFTLTATQETAQLRREPTDPA